MRILTSRKKRQMRLVMCLIKLSFDDLADCAARFLTSLATTAKPLPCSPALAASIEALSET